jgi:type IV secretion system protein VirD4
MLNLAVELLETTFSDVFHPKLFHVEFSYFFQMHVGQYPLFYFIIFVSALASVAKVAYNLRSSFKDLNQNQKGSSRFTTEKELQAQYKAVPERKAQYKGGGGVVISRLYDKILVDDSPVNNLVIGTTRSGKGETFVFPTIDVYSRAEQQPSLILNDPKAEIFAASKKTLEERGYHIEVLNLLHPIESMSYNLLEVIKEAYKEKDYSTAQALCKTLSHTLYYNPNVKDPFWQQCAMSLCNAMILAITDKCIKEGTEGKITMYAVANMLSELGSQEILDGNDEPQNALDMYFQSLPAGSVAKMQYATSNFSKGTTRGGIFTQTMNGLSVFTFDEIAKMTAKNSMDLRTVGFGKNIRGNAHPRSRVEVIFPNKSTETVKTDSQGRFGLNFPQVIQVGDEIQVLEKRSDEKTVIIVKEIDRETGETVFEVKQSSSKVSITSIKYFDKPVAIFMVTPDYDSSNHVIASIFVRQLYSTLAKYASLARGGKCYREVVFILDEFGVRPYGHIENLLRQEMGVCA